MALDRYWEEYELGETFDTSGRTVTDADIRLFIGATDATHPAHVNEEYAKQHPFGKVVVMGSLTVGVIDGLVVKDLVSNKKKIAHYGYDKIRFLAPVFPGDTISMTAEVIAKKERNEEFGIITLEYKVKNQRNEIVCIMHDLQMVERMKKEE